MKCDRSGMLNFAAKLRHCWTRIKEWCKSNFYSISKTKRKCEENILHLNLIEEQQLLTIQQIESRKQYKNRLAAIIKDEEVLWKARARQHWLKKGDSNTKFFYAVANGRRRENTIEMVEDEGRVIFSEAAKRDYFFAKFKEVFTPPTPRDSATGDWSTLFTDRSGLLLLSMWRRFEQLRSN